MLTLICCYTLLTMKQKYLVTVAKLGIETRKKKRQVPQVPTNRLWLVSSGSNILQLEGRDSCILSLCMFVSEEIEVMIWTFIPSVKYLSHKELSKSKFRHRVCNIKFPFPKMLISCA